MTSAPRVRVAAPSGTTMTGPTGTTSDRWTRVVRVVGDVADEDGPAGVEGQPDERVLDRRGERGQFVGALAGGDLDDQPLPVGGRQHEGDDVGVGDQPGLARDQPQRFFAFGRQQLLGYLGRCLQPVLAAPRLLIQPGVGDRDPGGRGQRGDQLLVLGAELAVLALGEIEVAEHDVADPDRHAEEAVHRRVVGREIRPSADRRSSCAAGSVARRR